MGSVLDALQNLALGLTECVSRNLGQQVMCYIDPNTMHHIFTFLGPILIFFAAAANIVVSAVFFLRHQLATWFRKTSGAKLIAVWLVLVSMTTTAIVVAYKLIIHLTTH